MYGYEWREKQSSEMVGSETESGTIEFTDERMRGGARAHTQKHTHTMQVGSRGALALGDIECVSH